MGKIQKFLPTIEILAKNINRKTPRPLICRRENWFNHFGGKM